MRFRLCLSRTCCRLVALWLFLLCFVTFARFSQPIAGLFNTNENFLRHGYVHPHLSGVCLGGADYSGWLNIILLQAVAKVTRAVEKNLSVIIAGVEYGAEVIEITKTGLHVVGFEPNPFFSEYLDTLNHDRFTLVHAGVNDVAAENISLTYQGKTFFANITTIDTVIKRPVLSIQVDTNTVDPARVLKGAEELITKHGVPIIVAEFEIHQCIDLLSFLTEQGYFVFDFLWIGGTATYNDSDNMKITPFRPDKPERLIGRDVADWRKALPVNDYCATVVAMKPSFGLSWVQNDIVAVHSSVMNAELLSFFDSISIFSSRFLTRQQVEDVLGEDFCD